MTKRRMGKKKFGCTSGNIPFCFDPKCPARKNIIKEMDRQLFAL